MASTREIFCYGAPLETPKYLGRGSGGPKDDDMTIVERSAQRIRHEAKRRELKVAQVAAITPKMIRVTLTGDDLKGFTSLGYDDHVKLFFPEPGQAPSPENPPPMRDYTPRRYDAAANTLDIDFVLHGDGPASGWASQVRIGQTLNIGGPRGSMVVSGDFDWYLLVGDETALPAIGRRLEELPASAHAIVIVEVADAAEEQKLNSRAKAEVIWLHRDGAEPGSTKLLQEAVAGTPFPTGEAYAFVAGESEMAKAVRQHLVAERGFNKQWIKAAGYWKRGAVATHEPLND